MPMHIVARRAGWLACALLLGPLAACNDLLKVNNPAQVPVQDLNDPALLNAQLAGVVSEFEDAFTRNNGAVLWSANFLTDEQVTGLNWEDYARVNQRVVNYTEGPVASLWGGVSRVVRLGEDVTARLETLSGPDDKRIALAAVLTGYGYVYVGESMCSAVFGPVENPDTTVRTPLEVFQRSIPHFQRALSIASATGQGSIVNLAHLGMARAYLNLADLPNTIAEAAQVTDNSFVYWVEYSGRQDDENNGLYGQTHGANFTMGVSPAFLAGPFGTQNIVATQTDPRIQHATRWITGHNGLTKLYKPYQGRRFSGYTGQTIAPASACPKCTGTIPHATGDSATPSGLLLLYQKDTKVMLGEYLEAQHDMFEAMARQGGNDAAVNAFVNARRAAGNEAPVTPPDNLALFAELRRQRSRDFYQAGLRLGDLRRWKRDGVGDFFPTGQHVNTEWGGYGTWTCFPLPLEEYEGNPKLHRPADPLTPPGI
jgi:hypothetical protein